MHNLIHKLKHMMGRTEFHLFLSLMCLLVFSWPFLATLEQQRPEDMFRYLFAPWAIVIVLLFLIDRFHALTSADDTEQE